MCGYSQHKRAFQKRTLAAVTIVNCVKKINMKKAARCTVDRRPYAALSVAIRVDHQQTWTRVSKHYRADLF